MKIDKIKLLLTCVATLFAVTSCSEKAVENNRLRDNNHIQFVTKGIDTQAVGTPNPGYEFFPTGAVLGVLAYNLPDGQYDRTVNTPDMLYNAKLTRLETSSYNYDPVVSWPSVGKVKFFAYHPHSSMFPKETIVLSPYNTAGDPKITIDFSKSEEKIDFAVATMAPLSPKVEADEIANGIPSRSDYFVNFLFKRKTADLIFRAKSPDLPESINIYVNSLSIVGISTKGTYNFTTDTWEDLSSIDQTSSSGDKQSVTVNFGSIGIPLKKDYINLLNPGNTAINDRRATVVMIPTKYDVIKLHAVYTVEYLNAAGGCEYRVIGTKDVPISVDWEAAVTYTYYLEFSISEAYGNVSNFDFKVVDWTSTKVDTSID